MNIYINYVIFYIFNDVLNNKKEEYKKLIINKLLF